MHQLHASGPAVVFARKGDADAVCRVQEISTVERLAGGSSKCDPDDYNAIFLGLHAPLVHNSDKKSGRLYHTVSSSGMELSSCAHGNFVCFDFKVLDNNKVSLTPAPTAIDEIRVTGSNEVYAVPSENIPLLSYSSHYSQRLYNHKLPGGFSLSFAEKLDVSKDGVVTFAGDRNGLLFMWMIDSFLVVPRTSTETVSMRLKMTRTCELDRECVEQLTVSTIVMSLSKLATVPVFTLSSQLLSCDAESTSDCEESSVQGFVNFWGNISIMMFMIRSLYNFPGRHRPSGVQLPIILAFSFASLNTVTFLSLLLRRRVNVVFWSTLQFLEVAQLLLSAYLLFHFDFGGNTKYITERLAWEQYVRVFFPFLLFEGNIFLTSTIVVFVTTWNSLITKLIDVLIKAW
tara:strand:+ start:16756 stop:17958 length:1203 start_codon:yes stop_codon:yes gene_type:complete